MKAAYSAQVRLLDLQATDTVIAQVEHRRASLPEHEALLAARKERARLAEELLAARTRVGDLQLEVEKAEADLVPVRERHSRNEKRIADGSITDPKQLNSMIEETAHLVGRISDLEDLALEAMDRLETTTSEHDQLAETLSELEGSARALIASRDEQLAELDAELGTHRRVRDQIAAELPADLLASYDRIRSRSGGVGAAELKGGRCGGCQLTATPAALAGFQAAAADEVLRCEECDRILVRTELGGV